MEQFAPLHTQLKISNCETTLDFPSWNTRLFFSHQHQLRKCYTTLARYLSPKMKNNNKSIRNKTNSWPKSELKRIMLNWRCKVVHTVARMNEWWRMKTQNIRLAHLTNTTRGKETNRNNNHIVLVVTYQRLATSAYFVFVVKSYPSIKQDQEK